MVYFLIAVSIAAMTAAQLLLKKGMLVIGQTPQSFGEVLGFFGKAFSNLYIIGGLICTLITALVWIVAVSKNELSYLYPFMAVTYLLVVLLSWWLFHENVTVLRIIGTAVICVGVFLVARS